MELNSEKNVRQKLICIVCGLPGDRLCSHCGVEAYCGKEHQKQAWTTHKEICKPYTLNVNEKLGRHVVTTKDLKAGELILKESPIVIGPHVDSLPICLACHQMFEKIHVISPAPCSLCKLPVFCSDLCADSLSSAHKTGECKFLQLLENAEDFVVWDNLQIILPLRCLALRDSNPQAWKKFLDLESHANKRRDSPMWKLHKETVVIFLFALGVIKVKEDCEILEEICGILDINCFELRGPNPALMTHHAGGESLRGVYLNAAMLAHDCLGNTHVSVDNLYQMTVHSSVAIAIGKPILFNYAVSFECTPERLARLEEGKCFTCMCRRCTDPTELGTYMSAITCPRCQDGQVVPIHEGLGSLKWKCDCCDHSYDNRMLKRTLGQAWTLIEDADQTDARVMEGLLKRLSRSFPPTSVVMVEVKQNLVALYRDMILREPMPSRNVLQRKITLCMELLQVLQAVEPGISRLRGITLYELHVPLLMLANREYESGEITGAEWATRLETAHSTLRDAVAMLVYEPAHSPEGQLMRLAMDELRVLRDNLTHAHAINQDLGPSHRKKPGSTGPGQNQTINLMRKPRK